MAERTGIFISYSHEDSLYLEKLRIVLRPLKRKGEITIWADTQIRAGQIWEQEIEYAISSARVAILLVSPYFLASNFIYERELPAVLKRAKDEGLTIIWIAVRPSLYNETEIIQYQAANDPLKRPPDSLNESELHKELVAIARKIQLAIEPFIETRRFEETMLFYWQVRNRTLELVKNVPESILGYPPKPNRWTVLQILEHLLLVEDIFRREVCLLINLANAGREPVIQRSSEDFGISPAIVPKASLPLLDLPFSLISSVLPIQLKEPIARTRFLSVDAAPQAAPRGSISASTVSSSLLESADKVVKLFKNNRSLDFEQMRHEHPSSGTNNPLEFLRLNAAHEQRHHYQIDETLSHFRNSP